MVKRSTVALAACLVGGPVLGPVLAQGSDVTPFTLSTLDTGAALVLAQVSDAHGCKGGNTPPSLQWSAPPPGTRSFAVTMVDLTADKGAGFWHWALFDLDAGTRSLAGKTAPTGAKSARNDFNETGYGGACPPPGPMHQYQLAVWALPDPTIPFDAGSSDREVGAFLKAHALGHADLTLTYKR